VIRFNNSIVGNRQPILVIGWLIVKNYLLSGCTTQEWCDAIRYLFFVCSYGI
jgi:hypothetical protein